VTEQTTLMGIVSLVLTCGLSAQAQTLSGTVVDPQQRVVVDAQVSLRCGNQTETHRTNGQGHFVFASKILREDCKILAVHPGFDVLELSVGKRCVFTLPLRLAEVRQLVSVKADKLSHTSIVSLSLSANDLKTISDDTSDLIAYAKHLAGVSSGADEVYVDGLPTDQLPPAERIETITINASPFSPEYSDGSETHIDIVTKRVERKFRLSSGGVSLGTRANNSLNSRLQSASNTGSLGLVGPVPYLPLAFTADIHFNERRMQVPIEAVVPSAPGLPIAPVAVAQASDEGTLSDIGVYYSKSDNLNVNATLYVGTAKKLNMNVSGLTLPEAGVSSRTKAREFRITLRKTGNNYVYHGGVTVQRSDTGIDANNDSLGVSVPGAFVAGGASISREITLKTKWTFKNVLDARTGQHYWNVGGTISRIGDWQLTIPNPIGNIQFDNLGEYILSATTGAHTGIAVITRGDGYAKYSSYTAAPFFEAEILRRSNFSLRSGLRADCQTAGGVLLSPRVSAVAEVHGFILKAGTGMFVHDWSNSIFLKLIENDGHHLQQFLVTNASLVDAEEGTATLESKIVPRIAPDLTPARDWVAKFSVEHPFGKFAPGVEYTWTAGTYLLGSHRLGAPIGWTDLLESNRALRKQQLHFRAQYGIGDQTLTAHYEWVVARDNTDGPFSFPARQNDVRGEWARSGVPGHNVTFVGNLQLGKAASLVLVESWHGVTPVNITSGVDAEGNGLYTDRAGRPRNSGHAPSCNSLDLFAHRKIPVPTLFSERKRKVYLDLGIRASDLLGNKQYVSMGTVIGSPVFGRPLAGSPGRSVRFSLGFSR